MATKTHRTDDHILNILTNTDGLLSEFVNAYPGKYAIDNDADWLDDWFKSRTDHFLINASEGQKIPFDIDTLVDDVLSRQATVVKKQATIISITPHYFRGFRNLSVPINLTGKLVVIDGRNSSGKTSLAEAFEWLFTGQLIRRSLGDMGDSKELENCIGNQLRPDEENTWVEVEFSVGNNETLKIKRILTEDYSEKKTSKAKSNLLLNNLVLSRKDEEQLLDELFAGNPPVLMQHSLRTFVSSTPSQRRDYFERLLRLDELAYIIEKSVVGNSRLTDFPSKTGSVIWREWEELKNISDGNTVKILKKGEKVSDRLSGNLDEALQGYAKSVFNINNEDLSIEETGRALEELQKQSREKEFYLLDELRPQKTVDQQLLESFSTNRMNQLWSEFEPVALSYIETNTAAEKIGKAQIAIAAALEDLINAGLSIELHNAQTCPLCAYSETPTLTQPRISEIKSWQPIQKAAQNAIDKLNQELNKISAFVEAIRVDKNGLIPNNPSPEDWDKAVLNKSPQIREAALVCKNTLASCREQTEVFDTTLNNIIDLTKQNDSPDFINSMRIEFESLQSIFPIVLDKAHDYLDSFHSLETMIGKKSREDPIYNNRQIWISLSQKRDELLSDFAWEQAKKSAQKELQKLREVFVLLREKLIESRRVAFSDGMTTIWTKLRSDRYSTFSRLSIPPAKGKGLPLEIEVKAELDDGKQKKEVDALRVFSESQINILGIAAFAVRSKLLGHKVIIFDDPVQSMDEDHFKTFCTQLLPELMTEDGQVIILTHNDTFAREISYSYTDYEDYVTMSVRHSRRTGCVIEEGNRRVSERLSKAKKHCEDGVLDDAWLELRKAIERLYIVTYIKYGPNTFKPSSWIDQTADYMWNNSQGGGVGEIFDRRIPGIGKRLKEILAMSVAGAHDKHPHGETDVYNAIKDLKNILEKMRLGSG